MHIPYTKKPLPKNLKCGVRVADKLIEFKPTAYFEREVNAAVRDQNGMLSVLDNGTRIPAADKVPDGRKIVMVIDGPPIRVPRIAFAVLAGRDFYKYAGDFTEKDGDVRPFIKVDTVPPEVAA